MARRRSPATPEQVTGRPLAPRTPEQAAAWIDWSEPLPCDRSEWLPERPCAITTGDHDEWCPVFAARRLWRDSYRAG